MKNIEENNEYVSTIDFILKLLDFSGMGIEFVESDFVYLDKTTGDFLPQRNANSVQIDSRVYQTLKSINNDDQKEYNVHTLKQCLRLLHNIIIIRFGTEIKSFQFI